MENKLISGKEYKDEITLTSFFKNSYMITINEERFLRTQQIFKHYFNGLRPLKVNGSQLKILTKVQNCSRSHISVIEYAKQKSLPFVVVFEDDAYPCENIIELLPNYLKTIPRNANLVLLGWSNHSQGKPQTFDKQYNPIISKISGAHAYILFESGYEKYLNYMKTHPTASADCQIFNSVGDAFIINSPMFIQYTSAKSMHNHVGYTYYGDHDTPPKGFKKIEDIMVNRFEGNLNRRVVVTMTSWKKRIKNCCSIIKSILNNTFKPDIIYLNLSMDEFPNKETELPKDLVELSLKEPSFKINWVDGPNTKSMKKMFPILHLLNDDDIIIIIDDDLDIPKDFIELRVKELQENYYRFPISGGTNPKWHLNHKIYGITYNFITSTSCFTKRMLAGYEKILTKDVIETYKDDTIYTMLCLSNGYYPIPSKYISTFCGVTERKILLKNEIEPMKDNHIWMSDSETIKRFEIAYNKSSKIPFKNKLFNLVMWDSYSVAGDNGEHLYRKIRSEYPWINMTFIISRSSPNWDKLYSDGFNLYPFDGKNLDVLMQNACFILWSKDITSSVFLRKYRDKSIFISHGTTSKMYDCSFYMADKISKLAKFVCCNSTDEVNTTLKYTNNKVEPLLLGFPRHDSLLQKSMMFSQKNRTKQILISFHYRGGSIDTDVDNFKTSDYLKNINEFLSSDKLKSLVDCGVRIIFIPHARFNKYSEYFKVPEYIINNPDIPFQDLFAGSDILITDFSSTSFEFAYMDKPTFVYIPDLDYVKKNCPNYKINNIKNYQHLIYCENQQKLFNNIFDYLNPNNSKRYDFSHKTFKYVDMKNSERLVKWMLTHNV